MTTDSSLQLNEESSNLLITNGILPTMDIDMDMNNPTPELTHSSMIPLHPNINTNVPNPSVNAPNNPRVFVICFQKNEVDLLELW